MSFLGVDETVDHLFVYCERLRGLLGGLREIVWKVEGGFFSHDFFH